MNPNLEELEPEKTPTEKASGCPSGLTLDLLLAGDLEAAQTSTLEAHLSSCARCAARRSSMRAEYAAALERLPAFSNLQSERLEQTIEQPPKQVRTRTPSQQRRWGGAAASALLLAAASWVLFLQPSQLLTSAHQNVEVRAKGQAGLGFFVKRGNLVLEGDTNAPLHPGDALQFSFAGKPGYLAVFSVDGAGTASVYYPSGSQAAPFAGGRQLLNQSTRLDAVLGSERIFALRCDVAVETEPLRVALAQRGETALQLPGCDVEILSVNKTP